ncbi:MAG: alpha/beta hydrolase [Dehalococcoidia bacterium]
MSTVNTVINPTAVRDAANADPEFQIAARYWNGALRLEVGSEAYAIRVRDGRVAEFAPAGDNGGAYDLRIAAPAEEWDRLLEPMPKAYYQDVFTASRMHNVTVEGEMERYFPYHPAVRRLIEVMSLVRHGRGSGVPVTVARSSQAKFDTAVGRYIYLPIDGVEYRVYFEETGQGIPILLQHTAGADGRQWRHFLEDPDFQRHFRMIAYDLPYHSKSVPPTTVEWWTQEYVLTKDFLMKVVVTLSHELGLERPIYMGSSIGGHLAGDLALYYPNEFRAVIGLNGSLATPPRPDIDLNRYFHPRISNAVKGSSMVAITAPTAPEAYRRECGWVYSQGAPAVFKGDLHSYMVEHALRETAGQIDTTKVAVFMLSGEYDASANAEFGAPQMVERIKGATYEMMPGMGHFPMAEDPVNFKKFITPVLDRIRTATAAR